MPGELISAARNGNLDLVRELLATADVNETDALNETALSVAARGGPDGDIFRDLDVVKELLQRDDININSVNKSGETALQIAVRCNNALIFKELLKDHRLDINAADNNGDTILMKLLDKVTSDINAPYENMFLALLEKEGINFEHVNNTGDTAAAIIARRHEHIPVRMLNAIRAKWDISIDKLKVLVTTKPGHDGFGDIYSANRFKLLIEELHPDWDIQLYCLRTIPGKFTTDEEVRFIDTINRIGDELGLCSLEKVMEYNPDIHISVAGWKASFSARHEDFDAKVHCKDVKLSLHIQEYNKQPRDSRMFMKVSEAEKRAMPAIQNVGLSLPEEIKEKIHQGDYYFAYGRSSTSLYIKKIIESSPSRPIYIVLPGLKEFEGLEAVNNAVHYDINTGEEIKKVGEETEVIIIRGVVPQNIFMSLLYNTSKPHVMITGDMSFTEALDAGKIPFLDWVAGDMTAQLYGLEYKYKFYNFIELQRRGPAVANLAPGMSLLSQPEKVKEIREHLSKRYHEMSLSAENIIREIEEFLVAMNTRISP